MGNMYCRSFVFQELAKPVLKSGTVEEANTTCSIMLHCLEVFLRLMFPIMPFVSEELYSYLPARERRRVWETTFPRPEEVGIQMPTL
jgi:valyl-tRNA synthetase